jgi:hypothetical protein
MADLRFVTTCMERLAVLRQTLGPTLDQAEGSRVVVVGYSRPDGAGDWVEANRPAARPCRAA